MTVNTLQVSTTLLIISTITIICADDISSSINTLLKNFYKTIKKNHNFIFSPFGLHSALTVIYEGAAGDTATSLQSALNVSNIKDIAFEYKPVVDNLDTAENITLNIASKMYVQRDYEIKEGFQVTAQIYFDVGVDMIDFTKSPAAAAQINNWVKEKTSYKIEKVYNADAFNPLTQAVLVNSIYFKGNWLFRFNEKFTVRHQFYISETQSISHPMMYQQAPFDYAVNAELDAQILRLQHQNSRFSMTIVLPNSKTGIDKLERKLSNMDLRALKIKRTAVDMKVTLPKFRMESTFELEDSLNKFGLGQIFTNMANLSNIVEDQENLAIQKVTQKVFIEVDEEGSEADAVPGMEITTHRNPPSFNANHPFMFFITARFDAESLPTTIVLFVGKLLSPTY